MRRAVVAVCAALLAFGLFRAAHLSWVCDDSFISFRYARNLVEGSGLVFNPGERVEGYTNFLWTVALAAAMKAGLADPIPVASALGIASYALLVLVLLARGGGRRKALRSCRSRRPPSS